MQEVLTNQEIVYCFTGEIVDPRSCLIETDLFHQDVLEAYTVYNLGLPIPKSYSNYFDESRGGGQGDYREGMQEKIKNVVDCLTVLPTSKRAIITIPNTADYTHSSDKDSKCLRSLHFFIKDNEICCSMYMRSQAAEIFPKNIHFVVTLMHDLKLKLKLDGLGSLFYHTTFLTKER